jgi:predicted RNA methylase
MDVFSNLQVACECLLDETRTRTFINAIRSTVKPNDVVLESGTGTGILSLAAMQSGAKKVFAVEIAEDLAELAEGNFKANGFPQIELIRTDVKKLHLDTPVDVVIMEMLDTGMVAEQQCQAVNALHALGIIKESTAFIPATMTSYLQLVDYDFCFYGFSMPCNIQARNNGTLKRIRSKKSALAAYDSVAFARPVSEQVNGVVKCNIKEGGRVNAALLKSKIQLSDQLSLWGTTDMNMPVVIPLPEFEVEKGQTCQVKIEYQRGWGFDQLQLAVL